MRIVAFLFICLFSLPARAEEPFLKPNDVIAFIGGEDMVAVSESGYLEMALTLALPDYKLKFRNLAKEGDTVYEQRRDLNFPDLSAQLDKAGATVVLCQFGKMECFVEEKTTEDFVSAYRNLIEKVAAGGKRRVVILYPLRFEARGSISKTEAEAKNEIMFSQHYEALKACAEKGILTQSSIRLERALLTNDGIRFSETGLKAWADQLLDLLTKKPVTAVATKHKPLLKLIAAKNKLWFHYTRPQNWAFLGGDRVEQPSSHDHINTSYRWFPVEMEEFLTLMAAEEEEIWKLAKEAK